MCADCVGAGGVAAGKGLRQNVALSHTRGGRVLARLTDALLRDALREARVRLEGTATRQESVSPEAMLKRGYALVFGSGGHALTSAEAAPKGAGIRTRFADEEVRAVTEGEKRSGGQGPLDL